MTDERRTGERAAVDRRGFLRLGAASSLATISLAGCDALSTKPSDGGSSRPTRRKGSGKESPQLAEKVRQGKLPSVKERLPKNPTVVRPVERVGVYGGTWHTTTEGPADSNWAYLTIGYDQLFRWDPQCTKVVPDIAESVDITGGGREYTIKLRPGTRWSDGEPFTADDVVFAYDDYLLDTDLNPERPTWLVVGGKPGKVEKVDDNTVRFVFATANGLFLSYMANFNGAVFTLKPKHYLSKFHIKYNPGADKLAKDHGLAGWAELFNKRGATLEGTTDNVEWSRNDLPVLTGWHITVPYGRGSRVVAQRNPYYCKVDPDGRQLPYIDTVTYDVITDPEVMLVKASNGDFGMHCRHFTTPVNKPVLARNREHGKYHFFTAISSSMNTTMIALNLTHEDPVMREIFQNKDFRIGLSYAINRPEIIKAVYQKQGVPWQGGPRKESEFYVEQLAKQYTEFDVAKANQHLDKAGYSKRDDSNFRLRPDGDRISFSIEAATGGVPPDDLELVRGYWKTVGIDVRIKAEDRSLFYTRKSANKHDANVWGGGAGLSDAILDPRWFMPFSHESNFAIPWANWYNGNSPSMKPPAAPRRQMKLYDQIKATADANGRRKLFLELLQVAAEEFYVIGLAAPTPGYGIVKDDFHNVPKSMPSSWLFSTPGPSHPEQYFIEEEA